jgi:hypothetical protein
MRIFPCLKEISGTLYLIGMLFGLIATFGAHGIPLKSCWGFWVNLGMAIQEFFIVRRYRDLLERTP